MLQMPARKDELLEVYLTRSLMAAREQGTPVEIQVEGVSAVLTPRMSVLEAAATCGRRQRTQDLMSRAIEYRGGAGRFLAP